MNTDSIRDFTSEFSEASGERQRHFGFQVDVPALDFRVQHAAAGVDQRQVAAARERQSQAEPN